MQRVPSRAIEIYFCKQKLCNRWQHFWKIFSIPSFLNAVYLDYYIGLIDISIHIFFLILTFFLKLGGIFHHRKYFLRQPYLIFFALKLFYCTALSILSFFWEKP